MFPLLVLVASCSRQVPPDQANRPEPRIRKIILISIDTLRADHVSACGYGRETTPNLDALADEGLVFCRGVSSSSWTLPAHASLFTSQPDPSHTVVNHSHRLPPEKVTMAQWLKGLGFTTGGIYASPNLDPAFGLDRGFDDWKCAASWCDLAEEEKLGGGWLERTLAWVGLGPTEGERLNGMLDVRQKSWKEVSDPRAEAEAEKWISEHAKEPFFLFVHFWDPHYDYIPPAPFERMFDPDYTGTNDPSNFNDNPAVNPGMSWRDLYHIVSLYDGEIRWTDNQVGKLLAFLRAYGLDRQTLIVITSDHGEEFFEHGHKGHMRTLYDESISVPIIIRPPGMRHAIRPTRQARTIDIFPTIMDLAGLPTPPSAMGTSLLPALVSDEPGPPAVSYLDAYGPRLVSVRTDAWKFLRDLKTGSETVYNLDLDPWEQNPLVLHTNYFRNVKETADRAIVAAGAAAGSAESKGPELQPYLSRELDSLGYMHQK